MNRPMVALCDELGHATFITETWGEGFAARCMCGWEDRSAGYDITAAINAERRHVESRVSHNGGSDVGRST